VAIPPSPVLHAVRVVKRFGPLVANAGIDFELAAGEIHTILGENGAGKSTFMKVLAGSLRPDGGQLLVDGRPRDFRSPRDALRAGIGLVHQDFTLIGSFTALENIVVGLPHSPLRSLPLADHRRALARLAEENGFQLALDRAVSQLSEGEKQRVEILKMLYREVHILLLDEPTSVLTAGETTGLFATLRRLAERGTAIVFISHKLDEALDVSDRITVLRAGKVVRTTRPGATGPEELAELMIGHKPRVLQRRAGGLRGGQERGVPPLVIDGLTVMSDLGVAAVDNFSLTVRPGEIVGIAGIEGNGQRELAEAVAGVRRAAAGRVLLGGRDVIGRSPREVQAAGLVFVPEAHGVIPDFSVVENCTLDHFWGFFRRGWYQRARAEARARSLVRRYGIQAPSIWTRAADLSGGNRQKLVVGRTLLLDEPSVRVILAAQPTRGLDVDARRLVQQHIIEWAQRGVPTVLISSELSELLEVCDRLVVINRGRVAGVFDGTRRVTPAELGVLMTARHAGGVTGRTDRS
jgi:general nucleoside transport system ATP-binding protein